uniref:NADH dehydrogenase subunit 5 n=1 Tax=Chuniphyes multidentata TaxID=316200 RepID=UPI0026E3042B|nr:NADH dehydrogenase subunit 5 [Chuniphyes multidentata]WJJ69915.1 NADH dehydrogenase subunit 5 [Chuniphyes multidentata]
MILIIIFLPLISFGVCSNFGRFLGVKSAPTISIILNSFAFLLTLIILPSVLIKNSIECTSFKWFNCGLITCNWGIDISKIAVSMLILVTLVSTLVHFYSSAYMEGDPHIIRFMSYLSLFTFFMLILISASSLPQLFIGWEGVGLCSYLLINFWYTRLQANKAAIKAMILNKIGDVALIIALSLLIWKTGTLSIVSFSPLFYCASITLESTITLLLLLSVIGKSAQLGLHMWLPDAMEGPTPVSALIHAATMVTAGVFLIIKLSPLFSMTPLTSFSILIFGSATAIVSASIGLVQNDLKKVIAYSTCSQLGFMVMITGYNYYEVSLFHLLNHGFFKALLFLSAGSIIHSVMDEQDFRRYGFGNLNPFSSLMILLGSLSLMGIPFLTGFYSKDFILELLVAKEYLLTPLICGIGATTMTAIYSLRLLCESYYQKPQFNPYILKTWHNQPFIIIITLLILALLSLIIGFIWVNTLLSPFSSPMIWSLIKWSPLIVTIIGGVLSILLLFKKYKFFYSIFILNIFFKIFLKLKIKTYVLVAKRWYFDELVEYYISKITLYYSTKIVYQLIDSQILELIGPTGASFKLITLSSITSHYNQSKMMSIIGGLFIFIFISLYILL